jgi:hypothetical protein
MTDYLELKKLRDLAGVPDNCQACGKTAWKIIPILLAGSDLNGHPTGGYGRFEAFICEKCGTTTLVDPSVFRVQK